MIYIHGGLEPHQIDSLEGNTLKLTHTHTHTASCTHFFKTRPCHPQWPHEPHTLSRKGTVASWTTRKSLGKKWVGLRESLETLEGPYLE